MQKRPVAYQLYSARQEAERDLDGVLSAVAGLGYDGVEFAGFYGHSAEDIAVLLKKHGLKAVSSHVPLALMEADAFGVLASHQRIGCPHIAVPYLDDQTRPGAPGFAKTLAFIHRFARLSRRAGIQLLYHNHDFEFVSLSGQYGLDFLYDAIPEKLLKTEIDVCWVHYAGEDPAAVLRKYAGRCPIVHLKDYVGRRDGSAPYALVGQKEEAPARDTPFSFRPFGYGCVDAKSVVETAIESGAEWFVVEQDLSLDRPPLEAAAMSLDTLRKLGVKG